MLTSRAAQHIFDSIKKSLERLQLDYVDVLQCHRFDYTTPIEETVRSAHRSRMPRVLTTVHNTDASPP